MEEEKLWLKGKWEEREEAVETGGSRETEEEG
jgi:hypothetical protein